jgi:hypothetical protein
MIRIDRCVCTGQSFATLCERAQANGWTFEQTCMQSNASRHCGMCRPYLQAAMRTGQVVFSEILWEEAPYKPPTIGR